MSQPYTPPTPDQIAALRDAYGGLARKESQIREDFGGLARREARAMSETSPERMRADYGGLARDEARAIGEADADGAAARMEEWQASVDADAAAQARPDMATRAAALRAAAGLPPISTPDANGFASAGGESVRLMAPGAPVGLDRRRFIVSPEDQGASGGSAVSPADTGAGGASGGMSVPPPASDAGAGGAGGASMSVAPPPASSLVSQAPPLVSQAPPRAAPAAAPGTARFSDGGAPGGAPGRPQGNDRAALVAQAIWDARQQELERATRGSPYYRIPASPEREQRQQVHRERALGYDPALLDEQAAIEANPRALTDAAAVPQAAPKPTYDPKVLAQMVAPPPEAKTQKQRNAFYSGLADRASADGLSLSALLASNTPSHAPKDLKPRTVAEREVGNAAFTGAFERLARERGLDPSLDQAAMAKANPKAFAQVRQLALDESRDAIHHARINATAAGIDERNTLARQQFEGQEGARLERVAAKTASNVEKYGEAGQLGFEQEKLRLQAEGHEATAQAERDMAAASADAVAKGEELRKRADAEQPGVFQSILGIVGAGLGAFGQGMVGGPNQYIQNAQHRVEMQAKSLTDDVAVQKGIEVSRLEQIKHNLQAKLAMGMSETAMASAAQMVGKVDLAILEKKKERSAMTRGNEKTASAVIPARAASVGGGPAGPGAVLKTLLAMRGDEEANAKLAAEGGESARKTEKAERGTLGGVKYDLEDVTSTAEGHKARDKLATWDSIEAQLKQLEAAASSYGQRAYNPARMEFLANSLGANLSIARGQGVVTNPEAERNVKAVSSWLDPKAVVADIRQSLADDRQALMTQLGAKPARR